MRLAETSLFDCNVRAPCFDAILLCTQVKLPLSTYCRSISWLFTFSSHTSFPAQNSHQCFPASVGSPPPPPGGQLLHQMTVYVGVGWLAVEGGVHETFLFN